MHSHSESRSASAGEIADTGISGLTGRLEHAAHDVAERADTAFEGTRERLMKSAGEISDFAEDEYGRRRAGLKRRRRLIGHEIRRHPFQTLLAAGALGFGLGLLVQSRF